MKSVLSVFFACVLTALLTCSAFAEETTSDKSMEHQLDLGYRGVSVNGNGTRAAEYSDFESGPVGSIDFKGHTGGTHILIDGAYTTKNDYMFDAHIDMSGKFKLNLSSERLWHNLEHIPYDPSQPEFREDGITSAGETRVTFLDQNPTDEYGLRVERDRAETIIKMGDYPGHVTLQYWRWQKKGERQLRFIDEGHDNPLAGGTCNSCHLQSKTREIDRVTEELSGSVDAHVGLFDFNFEQLYRIFKVNDPIPVDNFNGHNLGPAGGADFQHNEDPESRLYESKVMVRTALSGGLTGEAAYTYGRRENRTDLASKPLGVDNVYAQSEYNRAAGNLSWTPNEKLTGTFRFRMLDLDTINSDTVTVDYNVPDKSYLVRENVDLRRTEYSGSLIWRPSYTMTIKGDYDHEWITRGNTGGPMPHHGFSSFIPVNNIDTVWELPEKEAIDTLRITVTSRPFGTSALKLKAWYKYATSSDPAYGTSFNSKHEGFASAQYHPKMKQWGLNASARVSRELLDDHLVYTFAAGDVPVPHYLDRERWNNTLDFGYWANPVAGTSIGLNYGYIRSSIVQDLLFGASDGAIMQDPDGVGYLQQAHTLSAFIDWMAAESVSCHGSVYYTKSDAAYDPNFDDLGTLALPATSTDLKEISQIDIRQVGGSAGIDWRPFAQWIVGLKYTIDDYQSANSNIYDGTAQTGTLLLSRVW